MTNTKASPLVHVVTLNYNGLQHLQKFIPSILKTPYEHFEFIVGDNASTDGSIEWLQKTYPQLRLISTTTNLGYAGGYNYCLQNLRPDYFVLINNDVEVEPDWLQHLIQVMEKDKHIAVTQPKILSYHAKDTFEYAGACGGYMDKLFYPFCRGRVFDTLEKDKGQYNNPTEIFWASGACLCIRAEVFKQLQGFDEYYFVHHEEIDLCWRIQKMGYKILAVPQSVVYHVGGGTLAQEHPNKKYYTHRNSLVLIAKNASVLTSLVVIPLRMVIETGFYFLFYFLTGKWKTVFKILHAYIDFFKWLFFTPKTQQHFPSMKYALKGKLNVLLFVEYYVKRKKYFHQIVKK